MNHRSTDLIKGWRSKHCSVKMCLCVEVSLTALLKKLLEDRNPGASVPDDLTKRAAQFLLSHWMKEINATHSLVLDQPAYAALVDLFTPAVASAKRVILVELVAPGDICTEGCRAPMEETCARVGKAPSANPEDHWQEN